MKVWLSGRAAKKPSHRERVTFSSTQSDCDSLRSAIYLAATISLQQVEPPDVLMPRRNWLQSQGGTETEPHTWSFGRRARWEEIRHMDWMPLLTHLPDYSDNQVL